MFCLYSFEKEEEAVEIANGVDFGLGATVFSEDKERAKRVALNIEAGTVSINTLMFPEIRVAFGGVKKSGIGREGGKHGFYEFVNIKTVVEEE